MPVSLLGLLVELQLRLHDDVIAPHISEYLPSSVLMFWNSTLSIKGLWKISLHWSGGMFWGLSARTKPESFIVFSLEGKQEALPLWSSWNTRADFLITSGFCSRRWPEATSVFARRDSWVGTVMFRGTAVPAVHVGTAAAATLCWTASCVNARRDSLVQPVRWGPDPAGR